jgi:hypothetical protein
VNLYAKIAVVAAAAVLIVAVIGYHALPGSSGVGGPAPSPSAAPSATPTGTPVATGPVPAAGTLTGGRYRLKPLDPPSTLSIVADIPAGWQGSDSSSALVSPGEESDTGILIGFMLANALYSDACHWDVDGTKSATKADVVVGPTVDDLVAALKANSSYTSSAATRTTVGGFDGQEIELQLPGDDGIRACDKRPGKTTGDYFVFPTGYYAQGPNSRWHLYIVDVAGTRLITMVSIAQGTPQAQITAARAIVESFEITP